MKPILSRNLTSFVDALANEVGGDWILLGGSLLPYLGVSYRTTLDVDIVSRDSGSVDTTLQLMTLAEKQGWPPEAANSAASFFLKKIPDYDKELLVLKKGRKGTVYRPTFFLFLKLKLDRLSESDALDIRHYLDYCLLHDIGIDPKAVSQLLKETSLKNKKRGLPWRERLRALEGEIKKKL